MTQSINTRTQLTKQFNRNQSILFSLFLLLTILTTAVIAVDDCDHCTMEKCKLCQFNSDGLTACHGCENCCMRQGRPYIWVYEGNQHKNTNRKN